MANKTYTPQQMTDAEQLAAALVAIPREKRSIFALMLESMLIGAELAEKQILAKTAPYSETHRRWPVWPVRNSGPCRATPARRPAV